MKPLPKSAPIRHWHLPPQAGEGSAGRLHKRRPSPLSRGNLPEGWMGATRLSVWITGEPA